MTGLLKKDLYIIISEISWLNLVVILMPAAIGIANPLMLLPTLCLVLSFVFSYDLMVTFSSDEAVNWQKNASALPLTVLQVAGSKYLLFLLLAAASVLLELGFGVLVTQVFYPEYAHLVLSSLLYGFTFMVVYCAAMIPVTYQFGTNKSRHILLLLVLAVSLTPVVLGNFAPGFDLMALIMAPEAFFGIILILLLGFTILSFCITVLILRRKTPSI